MDVQAPFCSLCGTQQPLGHTVALPQQNSYPLVQIQRSYVWGHLHAGLLIFAALFLLRPKATPFAWFSIIFLIVLGICILRRNRLILPMMVGWMIMQSMWFVTRHHGPDQSRIVLPLLIWCCYLFYYYRRKDEFVRWL